MLNVGPGGNDGADNHQTEREQGHSSHGAAEPQDLTVGDEDDGQVLENGVHGDRKKLEGLGAGIDHANEEESDREPCQAVHVRSLFQSR